MRILWLLFGLILIGPTSAQAQDEAEPSIDVAASPRLDPVPSNLEAAVTELRRVVRRTNLCRVQFARTSYLIPESCHTSLAEVRQAPLDVRTHAVGLELVRSAMLRRGRRTRRVRHHTLLWAEMLGEGEVTSVRYLIRTLSMLVLNTINHDEQVRVITASLARITGMPLTPWSTWRHEPDRYISNVHMHGDQREPSRAVWLAWHAEHGEETFDRWRADAMAIHRANLEGDDSDLRVLATITIWAARADDREAIARAQMASPVVHGQSRRRLHRLVVDAWHVMPWQEASRMTRDASRERLRLRLQAQ